MTVKGTKLLVNRQSSLKDIWYFLQGEFRYFLYYVLDGWGLPEHVKQQYEDRVIQVTAKSPKCIEDGACVHCGCTTPDLFFADKACEAGCYEKMTTTKQHKDEQSELG